MFLTSIITTPILLSAKSELTFYLIRSVSVWSDLLSQRAQDDFVCWNVLWVFVDASDYWQFGKKIFNFGFICSHLIGNSGTKLIIKYLGGLWRIVFGRIRRRVKHKDINSHFSRSGLKYFKAKIYHFAHGIIWCWINSGQHHLLSFIGLAHDYYHILPDPITHFPPFSCIFCQGNPKVFDRQKSSWRGKSSQWNRRNES